MDLTITPRERELLTMAVAVMVEKEHRAVGRLKAEVGSDIQNAIRPRIRLLKDLVQLREKIMTRPPE